MEVIGAGIATLIGCWCIFKSIQSYFFMKQMQKQGQVTKAKVIELIRKESYDIEMGTSVSFWPVLEFTDTYNSIRQHKLTSITDFEKLEVGDQVSIMYDLEDEEKDILILTNVGQWKDVVGFFLSGFFAIGIGVSIYLKNV